MVYTPTHNTPTDYLNFEGKIIVCTEYSDHFNSAIIFLNKQTILGFDTETRPSFKKGIRNKTALIQFSTHDTAVLFRLVNYKIPDLVVRLLENNNIQKVGVGINQDIEQLQKLRKFNPNGFIDLQILAKNKGLGALSLRKLSEYFLAKKISKRQQLSNWELKRLTDAQIRYAATDAYAALLIYEKMI
ncbi:MAG: 3'-5' exonuclease [Bacteroidales bacterium]